MHVVWLIQHQGIAVLSLPIFKRPTEVRLFPCFERIKVVADLVTSIIHSKHSSHIMPKKGSYPWNIRNQTMLEARSCSSTSICRGWNSTILPDSGKITLLGFFIIFPIRTTPQNTVSTMPISQVLCNICDATQLFGTTSQPLKVGTNFLFLTNRETRVSQHLDAALPVCALVQLSIKLLSNRIFSHSRTNMDTQMLTPILTEA